MNKFIVILMLLSGCATQPDVILPPPEKVISLDPSAYELCKPLLKVPLSSTFEDILKVSLDNIELYADCYNKQKNSVKLLKKISNVE